MMMIGQYKVLCVGVNRVPGLKRLRYAEKDACTVAKYFESLKSNVDVTLLAGENSSRTNIIKWLKECSTIQGELNVVVFFAGHGSAEKNEGTKSVERCLWIDGSKEKNIANHKIKTAEILSFFNNPSHRLIFIIDACYNFSRIQDISIQNIFKRFKESERMIRLKRYVIISASAVNITALEDPRIKHGVLTYYFLQTLAGKYISFFRKKIDILDFLAILDRKVRNHRFLTDTGREKPLSMLLENGIMVHYNDENFHLPVLEPTPLIQGQKKSYFRQKLSQWIHFLNCTRLRTKIRLISGLLMIGLLIITLAHLSIVRIYFNPTGSPKFCNFLLGPSGLFLSDLNAERLGREYDEKFSLFLFKHNWVNALRSRLDEKGRIILSGNYLGERIHRVENGQMVEFILDNRYRGDMLFWHLADIKKLPAAIHKKYENLDVDQKKAALELLAGLGQDGRTTAVSMFNLKRETDRGLRDLFLQHFSSADVWEKNIDFFNPSDYLCLIRYKKQIPLPQNRKLKKKIASFLLRVARGFPDASIRVTDTGKLEEIYGKLKILAYFNSPLFQKKASLFLKNTFDAGEVIDLFRACRNFDDKWWVLEQFVSGGQLLELEGRGIADRHWSTLIYDLIQKLPVREKSKIIKRMIDRDRIRLIPGHYRDYLVWCMRDFDPTVIDLKDWERWLKNHHTSPYLTLLSIVKINDPLIFPFIEIHYDNFKNEFSEYIFENLYKQDSGKTLRLVKRIYRVGLPGDKLCSALFLYNKNHREYSDFIFRFIREAGNDKQKQDILKKVSGAIEKVLISMADGADDFAKENFRYLFTEKELFYYFNRLNVYWWPEEVKKVVLESKVPDNHSEGVPFLRVCEKLPDEYRKKMLLKICSADIDEIFQLNADLSFVKYYPEEFLKFAYKRKYHYDQLKRNHIVKAYKKLSYTMLRRSLSSSLIMGSFGETGFICEALIKKETEGKLNINHLQEIIKEFDQPVERMLLRGLRYHVHQRYFARRTNDY